MKSLTFRLTVVFALLVTGTTALVLTLGGWLLSRQMLSGQQLLNESELTEIKEAIAAAGPEDAAVLKGIRARAEVEAPFYYYQLEDRNGVIRYRSPSLGSKSLPTGGACGPGMVVSHPQLGRVLLTESATRNWRIQMASPLQPLDRLLRDYARVNLILLAAVAVFSLGGGYLWSRYALKPVGVIARTAQHINSDNLSERIPVGSDRDELASLAMLLNQMFDRLETSFNQVRRFTADASHELNTPLSVIRLNAEKLRSRLSADPELANMVDDQLEEMTRLQRIVERLLFLARADAGVMKPILRSISLPGFVSDFAEDVRSLAEDRGMHFILAQNDPGHCAIEDTLIRQLLFNLTNNALNAMTPGGQLTLASACTPALWRVTVTDEGPGLPEEQLSRIFARFVRFEQPGRHTRSHGLGLAICRSITELHGGKIYARNRFDQTGLQLILEIPLGS